VAGGGDGGLRRRQKTETKTKIKIMIMTRFLRSCLPHKKPLPLPCLPHRLFIRLTLAMHPKHVRMTGMSDGRRSLPSMSALASSPAGFFVFCG
jgi:hypothetical protein